MQLNRYKPSDEIVEPIHTYRPSDAFVRELEQRYGCTWPDPKIKVYPISNERLIYWFRSARSKPAVGARYLSRSKMREPTNDMV